MSLPSSSYMMIINFVLLKRIVCLCVYGWLYGNVINVFLTCNVCADDVTCITMSWRRDFLYFVIIGIIPQYYNNQQHKIMMIICGSSLWNIFFLKKFWHTYIYLLFKVCLILESWEQLQFSSLKFFWHHLSASGFYNIFWCCINNFELLLFWNS